MILFEDLALYPPGLQAVEQSSKFLGTYTDTWKLRGSNIYNILLPQFYSVASTKAEFERLEVRNLIFVSKQRWLTIVP